MRVATPLSTLRLAILGLLAREPRSGYDLRRVFATTPLGHFSSSPGAVYPALERLTEEGLVSGAVADQGAARQRVVYSLTPAGAAALDSQLRLPVTPEDVIWSFDHVILRFAFMDRLDHAVVLRFLAEVIDGAEAYVRQLERVRKGMLSLPSPVPRLALDHGIRSYRGHADWARAAIAEVSSILKPKPRRKGR
jgi:DNA-binding PadR family transcriptional regulator